MELSEWQTYELADFLMFSPATYLRMLELHNVAWWPFHAVLLLGAILTGAMVHARSEPRPLFGLMALAWFLVAYAFFQIRYAQIMWAAPYFAGLFALQGLLWVLLMLKPDQCDIALAGQMRQRAGFGLIAFAFVGYPLMALLPDRTWDMAEWPGLMPDPTVAATLGLLTLVRKAPWWLYAVPVLWSLLSALSLYAMDQSVWWVLPALAVMALLVRRQRA